MNPLVGFQDKDVMGRRDGALGAEKNTLGPAL